MRRGHACATRSSSEAARVARTACERARANGIKAGIFRPITLWPFPAEALAEAAAKVSAVVVIELSAGQMVEDVRLALERVSVIGGRRVTPPLPTEQEATCRANAKHEEKCPESAAGLYPVELYE